MTDSLPKPPQVDELQSGEDLALSALNDSTSDEVAESDELASSLAHLQGVIERNALELDKSKEDLKLKREQLRSIYENDTRLATAEEQAQVLMQEVKQEKARLQGGPQTVTLKSQIAELSAQKKEIEEALSDHLIKYNKLTDSTSFDTSDGDQWDFSMAARVKPRKKSRND